MRKVVLLGDFGVGKTSFGHRLANNDFHEATLATLGVAHFVTEVANYNPLGKSVTLEVWDTAGQERYRSLDTLTLYLRRAAGVIVVFDVTRRGSFDAAAAAIAQLRSAPELGAGDVPIVLACNKCDLENRAVDGDAVAALAAEHRLASYADTSCKTGAGVVALVRALVASLPDEAPAPGGMGLVMPGAPRDDACSAGCY